MQNKKSSKAYHMYAIFHDSFFVVSFCKYVVNYMYIDNDSPALKDIKPTFVKPRKFPLSQLVLLHAAYRGWCGWLNMSCVGEFSPCG